MCTCAVFERDIARYIGAHVLQADGLERSFDTHHSPKLVRVRPETSSPYPWQESWQRVVTLFGLTLPDELL